MSQPYKVFDSAEFTDRDMEFTRVDTILKEKSRGVLIFEGERGSGKTTLLLELFRRLHERNELCPFWIGLFPHDAPEFISNKNIWFNTERAFKKDDIPVVLNRLAHYLDIKPVETSDQDFQKDYFARGLAYRTAKTVPVLLVDSIYECSDDVRIEFEKYILAPLLASERVIIILSGRGKSPIWSRPELRDCEIFKLCPLENKFILEQLEKLKKQGKSKRNADEYASIADLSGGYPLIVRVMAESDKQLTEALDDAINIIIQETLPESERENLENIRPFIEKLALVNIPFRIPDVDEYLYGTNAERRIKTNKLLNLLLESYLLRYEGKGYQLNQSVIHPIRKWLALKGEDSAYLEQLQSISARLQEEYPSAKTWYQKMLPGKTLLPKHISNAIGTNKSQ
jgi:DNA polymerase III delta prime subunit